MARFDISEYKMGIIQDLVNSDDIYAAIDPQIPGVNYADDMLYKNIWPFYQIEYIQTFSDSYILMKVDQTNLNRESKNYVDMRIGFLIVSHHTRMQMPKITATRIDYISDLIDKMFTDSNKFGAGLLKLISNEEFVLPGNPKYLAREMFFRTFDLNSVACP